MLLEHFKLIGAICLILGIHIFISSSIYLHTALEGRYTGGYFSNPSSFGPAIGPGPGIGRDSFYGAGNRGSNRIVNTFTQTTPVDVQIGVSGTGIVIGIIQSIISVLFTLDPTRFGKFWLVITTFLWLVNLICFGIGFSSFSPYVQQSNLEGFYFSCYYINFLILSGALVYILLSLLRQFGSDSEADDGQV